MVANVFLREEWMLLYSLRAGLSTSFHRFNKRLVSPRGGLYADPHVVCREGQYFIFFEAIPPAGKQGHIEVVTIDEAGNCTEPKKVLERPYHLAYPMVIEWNDDYYMIPDSGANRTVDLYRCDEFPLKWSFHKRLMDNISGVDPTLFEYNGKWWMFLGVKEHAGASFSDELFLYYADDPLSDNWTMHPASPIVSDARKSRPAGKVLEYRGELYRLSQNCSRGYGYGVNLHKIVTLNETEYVEEDFQSLEPRWARQITGLHTLAHAGNLTVIDARVRKFRF